MRLEGARAQLGVRVACYAVLLFWLLVVLVPLYWVVLTSFKMPITVRLGPSYIPWVDFQPVLDGWRHWLVTKQADLLPPLKNSIIVALGGTTVALVIGSMAGYALSRFQYRVLGMRSEGLALAFLAQRIVPPFILVLPFMILFYQVGLMDTQFGLILMYANFNLPLVVWITRDFFAALPREIEESAMIDGCSHLQAFLRISVPLAIPGLVATFAICFVFTWNEYLIALMLTFRYAQTLTIYLAGHGYGPVLTLISVAPAVLVGLACERYITRGLLGGAIK